MVVLMCDDQGPHEVLDSRAMSLNMKWWDSENMYQALFSKVISKYCDVEGRCVLFVMDSLRPPLTLTITSVRVTADNIEC